jgi:NADH/NAD ratio-sensing transcriptional regulator Rex
LRHSAVPVATITVAAEKAAAVVKAVSAAAVKAVPAAR